MAHYASAADAMLQHRYGYVGDPVSYVGSYAWVIDTISNQVADVMSPEVPGQTYEVPIDLAHEDLFGAYGLLPKLQGQVQLAPVLAAGVDTGAVHLVPLEPSPSLSPGAHQGVDEGFEEFLKHFRGQQL